MNKNTGIFVLAVAVAGLYFFFSDTAKDKVNTQASTGSIEASNTATDTASADAKGDDSSSKTPKLASPAIDEQSSDIASQNETPETTSSSTLEEVGIQELASVVDKEASTVKLQNATTVMLADNYRQLVLDVTLNEAISLATDEYQQSIQDYLTRSDDFGLLDDYQVNCNDSICLAYLTSPQPELLDKAKSSLLSKNSPLHTGFFTEALIEDAQGNSELRIMFNSDPKLDSVSRPNL